MLPDQARAVLEECPRRLLRALVINGSEEQQEAVWDAVYPVGCTVDHDTAMRIASGEDAWEQAAVFLGFAVREDSPCP